MLPPLPVLYQDDRLIVVDKPSGLLVHPSDLAKGEEDSVMDRLKQQTGRWVWPVHRIDRPTSGVLMLALDEASARILAGQFENHRVRKDYLAIVRGHPATGGIIRHSLTVLDDRRSRKPKDRPAQPALTLYQRLATVTVPVSVDPRYPTARYSLVRCRPMTGRRHQIRRHLKHISHPIIGDTTYGKGAHNRYFSERFNGPRLYLHSHRLAWDDPATGQRRQCVSPMPRAFRDVMEALPWDE